MIQNNRKDLATTADNADIFQITQSGGKLINSGTLTTSGDVSNPVHVLASGASFTNSGHLMTSGDGSAGINVGDIFGTHYDNVTIANYGFVSTAGGVFDDGVQLAFADGIDVNGNFAKILNYGSIVTTNPDAGGIGMISANSTVINHGTIDSSGFGIAFDAIDGTEIHNTAANYGQIHTSGDESRGIWFLIGDNVARNYGSIVADGFHSFGIAMEGDRNHGENYGNILVTGEQGRGVLMSGEHLSFLNQGTIETSGVDSVGIRYAGENLSGTDGGTFTNYGTIESAGWAVLGADSDDHIINHGILAGAVDLGGGNDSYVAGKGGFLTGELILGDGDDLVVVEHGGGLLTIADFAAGAGTDDVLDLSAFGYHSLDQLLAHALQTGSDVLLNLSGHDQVLLESTALASLAGDDFLFNASHAIAGAVFHDVGAGLMAHPDMPAAV